MDTVTDQCILALEEKLGARLPADYKAVLLEYGCGQFHYVELLPVTPEAENGVFETTRALRANGADHFVAISINGCGDVYGFRVHAGCCSRQVYFYDHEAETIAPEAVADSTLLFLRAAALVLPTDLHLLATGRGHLVKKWWWW